MLIGPIGVAEAVPARIVPAVISPASAIFVNLTSRDRAGSHH
jgi:hypothetical protein